MTLTEKHDGHSMNGEKMAWVSVIMAGIICVAISIIGLSHWLDFGDQVYLEMVMNGIKSCFY